MPRLQYLSGTATDVDVTTANPLPVSGTTSTSDPAAGTGTITAADVASATVATLQGQSFVTGNATANSTVVATLSGHSSVAVELTGTWVGTLAFEESDDGGTTWVARNLWVVGTVVTVPSTTSNGLFQGNVAAGTQLRVRCTAYTSGTATVRIQPGYGHGHPRALMTVGAAANGAAVAGNPVLLGGSDGANARTLATDTAGNLTGRPKTLQVTGTGAALNDTPIAATDVGDYRSVSLQTTGTFSAVYIFECSNDNANWRPINLVEAAGTQAASAGSAANQVWRGDVAARFFRVRLSSYTSGTVSALAFFSAAPGALTATTVDTELPAALVLGDGGTNPTAPAVAAHQKLKNVAGTWDDARNNQSLTLLSSAARTATLSSADQINYNHNRLLLIVNVSLVGTGSITPSLQVKDSISGNYATVWTAAAAIVTGIMATYYFADGATGGTYTEKIASQIAGRAWRLTMTHNNANTITYSASAEQMVG